MSEEILEVTVDKFTFRFPTDLFYSQAGAWVRFENGRARIGISDFTQQRNGDVAFAESKEPGTVVGVGDEVAIVETIKINLSVPSPVAGRVVEANGDLRPPPSSSTRTPMGGAGWRSSRSRMSKRRERPSKRRTPIGPWPRPKRKRRSCVEPPAAQGPRGRLQRDRQEPGSGGPRGGLCSGRGLAPRPGRGRGPVVAGDGRRGGGTGGRGGKPSPSTAVGSSARPRASACAGAAKVHKIAVFDVVRTRRGLKPEGVCDLNEDGLALARATAEVAAKTLDGIDREDRHA